jgi:hypothetical protein
MRISIIATAALLSVTSLAHADGKRPLATMVKLEPAKQKTLDATEIQGHMKPANDQIGRCYLDAVGDVRGAGHMEIKLSIHRTGSIESIDVATPKLSAKQTKQIDGCVRAIVKDMSFPARRATTVAIIPYFYQRTSAPGAGPQYSCWDPKGCPTKK